MDPLADPAIVRAALERQLALVAPAAQHLRDAATAPSPLAGIEWSGPAAEAAERYAEGLRQLVALAADAVDDWLREQRYRIAVLA